MKKLISLCVIALAAMLASTSISAQLPSVNVKDTKGRTVNVSRLAKSGKPVIVSFFATWCKPCLRELRAISELYPDWQDETGVEMYIVSIDDAQNSSKVKPFVDAEGWDYTVLLDPNRTLFNALGLQSVPHTVVLDGTGKIIYNHSGYTDGAETELIEELRKAAKAQKPVKPRPAGKSK